MSIFRNVILSIILLSTCSAWANPEVATNLFEWREGGIVRGPKDKKRIALEFTADTYSKGGAKILEELERRHIKGSFFLTGNFFRKAEHKPLLERLMRGGHYIGPHSDKHPLYCPWSGEKKTLVNKDAFARDLEKNLQEIEGVGVKRSDVKYWIPPFEWYNEEIVQWSRELGLTLINFSSGTRSSADYTEDDAKNFVSSQVIFDSILAKEKKDGLNGFMLLLHFGVSPKRNDLMADRLGDLLDRLQASGYEFVRVDELLR